VKAPALAGTGGLLEAIGGLLRKLTPGPKSDQRTTTAMRGRLPNRRPAITTSFERDGAGFKMTAGFFDDGRLGEIKRDVRGEAASPIGLALDRISP
jgi:hypothetical protein